MADEFFVPQADDKARARSAEGVGAYYTHPERLSDETIETYYRPFADSKLKRAQLNQFAVTMATSPLVAIREDLRRWKGPAHGLGAKRSTLSRKMGGMAGPDIARFTRRAASGRREPVFPEEMPDLIAEEATKLWNNKPSAG
jgi:haloalkane dehalogenase